MELVLEGIVGFIKIFVGVFAINFAFFLLELGIIKVKKYFNKNIK